MRFCIGLLLVLICHRASAQSKWGIRINQNTDRFRIAYPGAGFYYGYQDQQEQTYSRISIGVLRVNDKFTHEIELSVPQIKATSFRFPYHLYYDYAGSYKAQFSNTGLRYALTRNIRVSKSVSFVLGGAVNPYFIKDEHIPVNIDEFYVSKTYFGVSLNVIGGVMVKPWEHFSIILDSPVKVFDYYNVIYHDRNKNNPGGKYTSSADDKEFFMNAFTYRLGVIYTFGG